MKKNRIRNYLMTLCFLCLFTSISIAQVTYKPERESLDKHKIPQWYDDAKFGMFIHWGLYSIPAGVYQEKEIGGIGEWIMKNANIPVAEYAQYATQFNPTSFNADEWVKLAKEAGMKYLVITSKHHDGFALFDSKVSDYDIMDATPFKRDIINEMAKACKKYGIHFGLYYSQDQDWHHKGGGVCGKHWDTAQDGSFDEYLDRIAVPQVKEILSAYNPEIIWWDTPCTMTKEGAAKFAPILENYPKLITNNRLGGGVDGDLETPEQFIPATGFPGKNWESCMTMNDTWGFKKNDTNWKSTEMIVRNLIDIASKGGNYLLNVGPTQMGLIPDASIERLKEVGDWMKPNGKAIYGTTASPFPYLSWGRATQKDQKLYLHVFDWPKDGKLAVPFLNKITKAYLLSDTKTRLEVIAGKENSTIQVPSNAPDKIASVVVVEFEGKPEVQPIPSQGAMVTASSTGEGYQAGFLTDGDPKNRWEAAKDEKSATLEIDLGKPATIQCIALVERWHPWDGIKQNIDLYSQHGNEWKLVTKVQSEGSGMTHEFAHVTAQKFKMVIGNEKEAPSVNEMILFRAE